jgi:hypothetical protein
MQGGRIAPCGSVGYIVPMKDFVPEDECPCCANVAPIRRALFRLDLRTIPLDATLCWRCEAAFWRNLGVELREDEPEPTLH